MLITIPHNHITKKLKKLEYILKKQDEPFVKFILTNDIKLKSLTESFIKLDILSLIKFLEINSSFSFKKKSKYFDFFSDLLDFFATFDNNLRKYKDEFLSKNYKPINKQLTETMLPEEKIVFYIVSIDNESLFLTESEHSVELKNISNKNVFFYDNKKISKLDLENNLRNLNIYSK